MKKEIIKQHFKTMKNIEVINEIGMILDLNISYKYIEVLIKKVIEDWRK